MPRNPSKDPGKQTEVAQRRAKAVALKAAGRSYEQIAHALGYSNRGTVHRDIQTALRDSRAEIDENLIALRRLEDVRYDDMRRKIYAVLTADHVVVQHGNIVRNEDGTPVRDHMPVLQAVDRLLKLESQYAVLHGLNADERMVIAFEQRSDVEAAAVVEAVLAGFSAVEMPADVRLRALEAAQHKLESLAAPVVDGEVVAELEE